LTSSVLTCFCINGQRQTVAANLIATIAATATVLAAVATAAAQDMCDGSPEQQCRMVCRVANCPDGQCMMREGNCCEMGCQSIGGDGGGGGEPTMDCPDINDDGVISVGDILAMLSAFGSDDAAADINDDGTVSVTDILGALSSFGDECSLGGGDSDGGGNGVVGGDDGSDGVNCCSGGSGCGYQHCPAIGDGQDGCVQPWNMPEGMNFDTDCGGGGDSDGESSDCVQGADCGGQEWNDCGTSCPSICGSPAAQFCNFACNAEYQCTDGQFFDGVTGTCEGEGDCTEQFSLPPGVAMGRPFSVQSALLTATIEECTSDWSL